jgi:hypothetical protein
MKERLEKISSRYGVKAAVMDIYPYERHGDFQGIRTAKADDASNPVHGGRQ